MIASVTELWPYGAAILSLAVSLAASYHIIVLRKGNLRSAIGWIGVVWLSPYLGTLLYFVFGINRIRRRASRLRSSWPRLRFDAQAADPPDLEPRGLASLVGRVTGLPLLPGNRIRPLINGEEAYPAMLEAIRGAEHSIGLATYIFDNDPAGRMFAEALGDAVRRGVEVRVLIDSVGSRYTIPSIFSELARHGVRAEEFLHSFIPWRMSYLNLRCHRKIMVVDGRVGFTGGMNIRDGHQSQHDLRRGIADTQFKVEGPVVEHLARVFADDWAFTTGETLSGDKWFPKLEPVGDAHARGVPGGPDEDFEKLRFVMTAALAAARQSVRIVTPYFLPDDVMITALNLAAMRGIPVDIVIPARGNLRLVEWASRAQLDLVIRRGCRVWCSPAPFDHSKLFVVDDCWAFIGSANWDPRSLFLNFEFNLECYGADLARQLARIVDHKIARSTPLTLEQLQARSRWAKLRDGMARLISPYL
ncbi:MAG TPA: cardiolipin synthase [Sphingomonadales bacterium]